MCFFPLKQQTFTNDAVLFGFFHYINKSLTVLTFFVRIHIKIRLNVFICFALTHTVLFKSLGSVSFFFMFLK